MASKDYNMRLLTPSAHRRICRVLVALASFVIFVLVLGSSSFLHNSDHEVITPQLSKSFVVASIETDDTSWLHQYLAEWDVVRYVADDPKATFTVPQNKGREAMAYLT